MTHAWHDVYRHPSTPAHHLDPRGKLLAALAFIGGVLLSAHINQRQAIGYTALLLVSAVIARISPREIATRFLTLLPFIALMTISTFLSGLPKARLEQALLKSLLCLSALALVSIATPFPDFLRALEEVRLPKILILFMAFVYRYIAVLGEEVVRVERGWSARYFGQRWQLQWSRLGHVIAALLVRSYERAERVYAAMLARGFSEQSSLVHVLHFERLDFVFAATFLAALSAVRWGLS